MGKSKRNEKGKKATNKTKQLLKDFEKKKRKKLGKKLKPANATEISFRSHSIHVSKQSLKDQNRELRKSLALISSDISEALIGISSHKAKVRQYVLFELKAILSRIENNSKKFKSVLHQNLVEIVSIFELVYDSEEIVRTSLKTFINWFMPRCKNHIQLFGPFWCTILAHLSAALSHINIKIRYNALKILRSFFSVSSVANYFSMKWCLNLLSHLELLFYDIIRSGHFILNDDDIKMITSLSKRSDMNYENSNKISQNSSTQKIAKTTSNHQQIQIIVHILCECATHIIRVIQKRMHNSYDTIENNLHALLLPNDNKMYAMSLENNNNNNMELNEDEDLYNEINSENMQLLKSLLSVFMSCSLIFEQFGKKNKYSAMSMVLTLLCIITDCLCDNTLKELVNHYLIYQQKYFEKLKRNNKGNKRHLRLFKVNDLRLFISKALMSLFYVFPIEFVEQFIESDNENKMDEDDNGKSDGLDNKKGMNKLNVMRMNMKTIKMCTMFIEYWKLNLLQKHGSNNNNNRKGKMNYFKISYEWLYNSLNSIGGDKEEVNTKIVVDLLQILKILIPFYDEKKQLQLLLCVDKLMGNSAFVADAKTIFGQFVN